MSSMDGCAHRATSGDDPPLDRGACGLFRCHGRRLRGLVWATSTRRRPRSAESLGGSPRPRPGSPWKSSSPPRTFPRDRRRLEGVRGRTTSRLHIPLVHRELNREIDAARYEVHVGDRWCRHEAPTRSGGQRRRWLWRWPNVALNLYPDSMNLERFLPRLGLAVSASPTATSQGTAAPTTRSCASRARCSKKRPLCAAVQRNLAAGTTVRRAEPAP